MAFTPNSYFKIGKYQWYGCNDLVITKTIRDYKQTAVLKMPTSFVMKSSSTATQSMPTSKVFNTGDEVTIRLGYNGKYNDEFVGFVTNVNQTTPAEIEMEGYSWQLRKKTNIKKSWSTTTLKEVLQEVIKGTDITLHPDIPDVPLRNIVINNASGTQVIDYLKDLLKGVLTCYFIGKQLYMGLTYYDTAGTVVKHRIGWNVKQSDSLKYRKVTDVNVKIEIKYRKPSGEQHTVTAGKDGGVTRSMVINSVMDEKQLTDIAQAKLRQECFDGYEGTFDTLLYPYCEPGYVSELSNPRYPEQQGQYFVESVTTKYGENGASRTVGIGIKLN